MIYYYQNKRGVTIMNIGENREQVYATHAHATQTARNTHAHDGTYTDGTTYEFKTLVGSKPSLGSKKTLEEEKNIRKAIEKYLIADYLVVEVSESNYLKMDRQTAVEWLLPRVVLSKASEKRGGWYKLRFGKNERTENATQTILEAGYTL